MQQDYGITQFGAGPVKALCSNQRAAEEAGGAQEFNLEFVRETDGAEAFCEERRRFLICSKKMIIHVVAQRIPLSWNADTARVFV